MIDVHVEDKLMENQEDREEMKGYTRWLPTTKIAKEEARLRFDEVLDEIFENRVVEWERIFKVIA